jgi:hypothetical protein
LQKSMFTGLLNGNVKPLKEPCAAAIMLYFTVLSEMASNSYAP